MGGGAPEPAAHGRPGDGDPARRRPPGPTAAAAHGGSVDTVPTAGSGRRLCQSLARWNVAAARSTVASSPGRPASASPTGSPATKPHGTLATGAPASVQGELNGIT